MNHLYEHLLYVDIKRSFLYLLHLLQLSFIVKLIAVVSKLSQHRWDIYILPINILSGQQVLSTHQFIIALATTCIQASIEDMNQAVASVLEEGDASLYKRAVRTRASFKRFQAMIRGWRVRKQYGSQACTDLDDTSMGSLQAADEASQDNNGKSTLSEAEEARAKAQAAADELLATYNDTLCQKTQAEDELKATQEKIRFESGRLKRILNLGSKHKKQQHQPLPPLLPRIRPPYSAPSNDTRRNTCGQTVCHLPRVDEAFVDRITNLSITERDSKRKAKRIEEREHVLKQRLIRSKQKESELKLQEERITDLADKIRRQQLQLKEQKLQFEQSKLTAPPSPPDSTSRPCALCTEKEKHLRGVKDKVKRRMKLLSQRETEVISRAHELRRREIKLLRVRDEILDSSGINSNDESSHEPIPSIKNGSKPITKCQNEDKSKSQQKSKRKRRHLSEESRPEKKQTSCSSDSEAQTTPPSIPADASITSIRSSFCEAVPTIAEEPLSPTDDEDSSVETYNEEDSHSENIAPESKQSAIASTNNDEAGLKENQLMVEAIAPMRVPTLNESVNRRNGDTISMSTERRKTPLPKSKVSSTAKQRHVFAFEKNMQNEKNRHSESRQSSSTGSRSDRREEDDWISSFDVQMKCAMNKLNQLT